MSSGDKEKEHIAELMATLKPHQLEEVAASLILAAKNARQSGTPTHTPSPREATSPREVGSQQQELFNPDGDATMRGTDFNSLTEMDEHVDGSTPILPGGAGTGDGALHAEKVVETTLQAAGATAPAEGGAQVAPSTQVEAIASAQAGTVFGAPAPTQPQLDGAAAPPPVVLPASIERNGSRSPRRGGKEESPPSSQPLGKQQKSRADDDAPSRGRSQSSAASAKSASKSAQHFAELATCHWPYSVLAKLHLHLRESPI